MFKTSWLLLLAAVASCALAQEKSPKPAPPKRFIGRPNMVTPAPFVPLTEPGGGSGPQLGRFSRKAQVTSLLQQIVEEDSTWHVGKEARGDPTPVLQPHPLSVSVFGILHPRQPPRTYAGEGSGAKSKKRT